MNQQPKQAALFIGIDWADQKHDIYVTDRSGQGFHRELEHSPESVAFLPLDVPAAAVR